MCRCVFQLQTNVKTHPRWAQAKAIEAKDICIVSYALPLTPGPFSIIFRWNINRAVNNNPLYWTMRGACITPRDVYASMIERYARAGSRDALDHSYSAENFRGTASRAINIRINVPQINQLRLFLSRLNPPMGMPSQRANRVEFTSDCGDCGLPRPACSLYDNDRLYCVPSNTVECGSDVIMR